MTDEPHIHRISDQEEADWRQHLRDTRVLDIWTVFDRPDDYPTGFIARKSEVPGGVTAEFVTGATLEEVRSKIPPGLYPMARHPLDEPAIVESWM